MHDLTRTFCLLLAGSLVLHTATGQTPQQDLRFESFTTQNGLPSGEVTVIIQDRLGFLWMGSHGGLLKYDGYTFTSYKTDPVDPGWLKDRHVMALLEDQAGDIWVGTVRGGLSRFDRETETFTHYLHDPGDPNSLVSNFVTSIVEDEPGILWIATTGGLNRLDTEANVFRRYQRNEYGGLRSDSLLSLHEDRYGILWVGSADGLHRFDPLQETFTHLQHEPNDPASPTSNIVTAILEDQAGTLWIGFGDTWFLNSWEGRLQAFDQETGAFTSFRHDPSDPNSLSSNRISTLFEDRAGTLWIGTRGGGLNQMDRSSGRFIRYQPDPDNPESLSGNSILSILEDRSGILWVGTFGALNKADRSRAQFRRYTNDQASSPDGLEVRAIFASRKEPGIVWVGTTTGLMQLDRSTGHILRYGQAAQDVDSPLKNLISALYEDADGVLWIGSENNGLNRFALSTNTLTQYRHDPGSTESLCDGNITSMIEDHQGVLWIGIVGGLSRLDRQTGAIRCYQQDGPSNRNAINVIYEAPSEPGVLWIGTTGYGLHSFDTRTDRFTSYFDPFNMSWVRALYEDRAGRLWVGTYEEGLHLFDRQTGTSTRYTEKDGLANDVVLGILEDDQGRLWISTRQGLSRFEPDTERFTNYDAADGLRDERFNTAAFRGPDGELFFGTPSGLITFLPDQMQANPHLPQIALTGFKLFDQAVVPGPDAPLQSHIATAEEIVLSHTQNDFSFDFVALHYEHPTRNRYAYLLEPYDETWRAAGAQRTATYTNLGPGQYMFRVKAANADGLWDEEGTAITVTILPPWWRTTGAYVLYGLLFLAGVFAIDRFQRRRLVAKEREKTRERELEQARQIEKAHAELQQAHTHLKATQAQLVQQEKMASLGQLTAGIAHEIKNPLNFVNNFAEVNEELADELREAYADNPEIKLAELLDIVDDLKQNAGVINQHGKRADGIVHAMMQHASGGTGQREATDLNQLVSEHIELVYHGKRAQVPGLTVEIKRDFGEEAGTIEIVPQEIGRVLLNLLGNAFDAVHEHAAGAGGDYAPTVTVSTRKVDGQVEIRVSDNGPGIPPEIKDRIFEPFFTTKPTGSGTGLGLSLSYDIVTQGHGGTLAVESKEGKGATFIITLPVNHSVPASSA